MIQGWKLVLRTNQIIRGLLRINNKYPFNSTLFSFTEFNDSTDQNSTVDQNFGKQRFNHLFHSFNGEIETDIWNIYLSLFNFAFITSFISMMIMSNIQIFEGLDQSYTFWSIIPCTCTGYLPADLENVLKIENVIWNKHCHHHYKLSIVLP